MGGLYNLVFGQNDAAGAILAALDLTQAATGRFRDAWVEPDGDRFRIALYTRNGGGNRQACSCTDDEGTDPACAGPNSVLCTCTACAANHVLPAHPLHLYGKDDDFDSTYRTEYFSLPEQYADELRSVALKDQRDPSEAWLTMLARLNATADA